MIGLRIYGGLHMQWSQFYLLAAMIYIAPTITDKEVSICFTVVLLILAIVNKIIDIMDEN